MVRRALALLLVLTATGCPESTTVSDAGELDAGASDAGPPPPPADALSVVLLMDNSNSTIEAQHRVREQLPSLLTRLATGDRDDDGTTDFEPFDRIRFGVITPDMGTGGYVVPTCTDSELGDDGVLRATGPAEVPQCQASYPPVGTLEDEADLDGLIEQVRCVSLVGSGGCGFEQPLEATLKALSPAAAQPWTADGYVPPMFFRDTTGHGVGANAGLLEDDELLAVIVMMDEDDCSAADPSLYDPTNDAYGGLDRRCDRNPDALHPIGRYAEGLLSLRRHPSRLVYFAIAGMPEDLEPAPGTPPDYERLVSDDPAVRDERMQPRADPFEPGRPVTACDTPGVGLGLPGVRLLEVGEALEARGVRTGAASVCSDDHSAAFDGLLRLLRP